MQRQINLPLNSREPCKATTAARQLLPFQGDTRYYGPVYGAGTSDQYLDYLLKEIPWKHDEAILHGKHYVTARQIAWYGDQQYSYRYSGKSRTALLWTEELLEIKEHIEQITAVCYNSCLLNLYEDGTQGMGWHSDDEKELGPNTNIASVSFGAVRRFDLRHSESKEKISLLLEHGSLLVMSGTTQSHWQHQLPKTRKISQPRVNLTFRKMLRSL